MLNAFLLTAATLASLSNSQGARELPSPAVRTAVPPAFLELPGIRKRSDQLIVRPLQRDSLRKTGLTLEATLGRQAQARQELQRHDVRRHVAATDEFLVRIPAGKSAEHFAGELMDTGLFEYAELDWILYPLSASSAQQSVQASAAASASVTPTLVPLCPDDPMFAGQWHHRSDRMASCEAWSLMTGTSDISIGVCDTGLRLTHQDLQQHRLEGYNAVDRLWESQGGDITPAHYHGTRTTGTLAANGNNGIGISGVGWNFSHRMLRVSNAFDGGAQLSDLQHAARTSIESGDRIASVSYHGASSPSNAATATYIKSIGGLILWGSGNTGSNYCHADRDADDLIVVGATDVNDLLASFSSYGTFVDLVAPGVGILLTDSGSDTDYAVADGTSYACPLAAGVCAMIWNAHPTLSPNDVERILKASCVDLGTPGLDISYGYGRVRTLDAVTYPIESVPSAEFSAAPLSGASPLVVDFRDLSVGAPSAWSWDFGDGATSTLQNPAHTYTASGAFTVTLTVTNSLGQDQSIRVDYILSDIVPPVAEFDASPVAGLGPMDVTFSDLSGGGNATSWLWDFGDGATSTLQNPAHLYTVSGIYTVTLTASNAYGSDLRVRQDLVAVDFIPPVAGFSATPTSGPSPIVVNFSDESLGGVVSGWQWYFGDGATSTLQNPSHTYTAEGVYSVRLTVSNPYGSDELWRFSYINIGPGGPLLANFTGTPTAGTSPLTVHFTDLSVGNITNWEWNFGDGVTSTLQHPTHVYTSSGEYDVALQVGNASGSDDQLEIGKFVVVQ